MTEQQPERENHPAQIVFFIMGLLCLLGSVAAGGSGRDVLCIALTVMSVALLTLYTLIHLRH